MAEDPYTIGRPDDSPLTAFGLGMLGQMPPQYAMTLCFTIFFSYSSGLIDPNRVDVSPERLHSVFHNVGVFLNTPVKEIWPGSRKDVPVALPPPQSGEDIKIERQVPAETDGAVPSATEDIELERKKDSARLPVTDAPRDAPVSFSSDETSPFRGNLVIASRRGSPIIAQRENSIAEAERNLKAGAQCGFSCNIAGQLTAEAAGCFFVVETKFLVNRDLRSPSQVDRELEAYENLKLAGRFVIARVPSLKQEDTAAAKQVFINGLRSDFGVSDTRQIDVEHMCNNGYGPRSFDRFPN